MIKLSDIQAVILSATAQRDDGAVLPLAESLRIKGGAVDKVLRSLKAKGLIDHQGAPRGDDPPPLRITPAGRRAIGVETKDEASECATPAETGKGAKRKARVTKAAAAEKRTLRSGTKQALMVNLLMRPEGATIEQIAAATGVEWRRSALPPCGDRFLRPPLRTGRASFPASGSPCSAYG
jgi:DNA-binding MarR family transcriptional regulator